MSKKSTLLTKSDDFHHVGTLFIGAGPSTLGVFTHAYQTNRYHYIFYRILRVNDIAREFAIIDPSDQFGGGNLQQYFGLRSNTSSSGFLKVLQHAKPKKQQRSTTHENLQQNIIKKKEYSGLSAGSSPGQNYNTQKSHSLKIQVLSSEAAHYPSDLPSHASSIPMVMPQFMNLSQSDLAQFIRQTGKVIAPLQIIGSFLSYVGNMMLYDIHTKYNKKLFYAHHKAKSIQVNEDGSFTTTVEMQTIEIQREDTSVKLQPKVQIVKFISKNVVMGCGGKQKIPQHFNKRFEIPKEAFVYTSDEVLREKKFQQLVQVIKNIGEDVSITIIGGSHSAFSIAWLLLNGPCRLKSFNGTHPQYLHTCQNCNSCPLKLNHSANQKCLCLQQCKCLSVPKLSTSFANDMSSDTVFPVLKNKSSLKILYRDRIKVYYSSTVLAQADQYQDYDQRFDVSKGGVVYPFTGLRGDAKELWRKIKKGQEERVELVRADSHLEQKIYTKRADIVIWACGYQTNQVPVVDSSGHKIHFKKIGNNKQSTYEVDQQCKLLPMGMKTIDGLYGIGLGYSLKTTDNLVQAEQRTSAKADSVGLYVKQIGHKLLPQLLGRPRTTPPLQRDLGLYGPSQALLGSKHSFFMTPSKVQPLFNGVERNQVNEAYFKASKQDDLYSTNGFRKSSMKKRRQSFTVSSSSNMRSSTAANFNKGQGQGSLQPQHNSNDKQGLLTASQKQGPLPLNQWFHQSPEIKKSKLLIPPTYNPFSATLTAPLTLLITSQPSSVLPTAKKEHTPLRGRGIKPNGNGMTRYNQQLMIMMIQGQQKVRKIQFKH